MKEMDLKEELGIRSCVAKEIDGLVNEMNRSVEFGLHKVEYAQKSGFACREALYGVVSMLTDEATNLRERVEKLTEVKRSALLPLSPVGPVDMNGLTTLYQRISKMMTERGLKSELELFAMSIYRLRSSFQEFECCAEPDDERTVELFEKMRARYRKERAKSHQILRKETYFPKESLKSLIEKYRDELPVRLWNDAQHDVAKTIEGMRDFDMTESALMTLVEYLDEYDELQKMIKDGESGDVGKNGKCDEVLCSEEAEVIWGKLYRAGIVNKRKQPKKGLSWAEMGVLARVISDALNLDEVPWKAFGELWNKDKNTLRTSCDRGLMQPETKIFEHKVREIIG